MSVHDTDHEVALGELVRFRQEFYGCLTARADALFELAEAVLCTEGPAKHEGALAAYVAHELTLRLNVIRTVPPVPSLPPFQSLDYAVSVTRTL
ncbi:hypothetical protein [Actinocrispum wychmicini]|nr:hypothetical protein [Actinocrispum wychmicini]